MASFDSGPVYLAAAVGPSKGTGSPRIMIRKTVITKLDQLLKPLLFKRRRSTWNRRLNSFVDVIDVQVSKSHDALTVNVGVTDADVYALLWGASLPEFVIQPRCTVCLRIGTLIDDRDRWWLLNSPSTADDMVEDVTRYVLPFFARRHTREALKQWLTDSAVVKKRYPPPIINLAILQNLLGEKVQGCALLAELQNNSSAGDWRIRAGEVAARLHCA